jgi:hypothetical protein
MPTRKRTNLKKRKTLRKVGGNSNTAYNELIMYIVLELNDSNKSSIDLGDPDEPETAQIIEGNSNLIKIWNAFQIAKYEEKACGECEEQSKLYQKRRKIQEKLNKFINKLFD